jgi:alkyldihydroxyacetonephosphate synthase
MVVGLEAVFPDGGITRIKNVPRRAAGPDIRHVIIGNEGTLCYITEVTVKIFKYFPENNKFLGYTLDNMETGFEILREVMVNGYRPSVARLYDAEDGSYHFSHFAEGKCVLIFVAEGAKPLADATAAAIAGIVARYGECVSVDSKLIENWFAHLNWDPANLAAEKAEIMETKNICNTTEISANWGIIHDLYDVCIHRVKNEIPHLTLLGAHSSHSYLNGTNLYFVYFYNVVDCRPEEEIDKYHLAIKKIIVEETIKAGGSMCHHHGVGKHRTQWIEQEYGSSYYILRKLKSAFDPNGIMNMGTISPLEK